jgi:polysaccharide pyruvyl transferase WcaK-like protein
MKFISVLDTSVTCSNLGNQIIMDSVLGTLNELFPDDFLFTLPWEGAISPTARRYMGLSHHVFFGGTNSLSSHMLQYKQMGFRTRDLIRFNKLILLGVGWWQHQGEPDLYTKLFLRRLLRADTTHSVRDEYTRKKLIDLGIPSVANTSCPTTWNLTPEHCALIPKHKAPYVVTTLTDYYKSREHDGRLLATLLDLYEGVYCWIQGAGDLDYIQSFDAYRDRITLIPPKLAKYDHILDTVNCDYIGTRLHAGIRAIQRKRRTLILAVDNRATEISRDTGLNVLPRNEVSRLEAFVQGPYVTSLNIPFSAIARWKAQFA